MRKFRVARDMVEENGQTNEEACEWNGMEKEIASSISSGGEHEDVALSPFHMEIGIPPNRPSP